MARELWKRISSSSAQLCAEGPMIVQQFHTETHDSVTYMVVDEEAGEAILVNPYPGAATVEAYVDEAAAHGATISQVLLTHGDERFLQGYRELRERIGTLVLQRPQGLDGLSAEGPALRPLGVDVFVARRQEGVLVVDTRPPADFARQHFRGALNLALHDDFCTWAGTLLEHGLPLLIVATPGEEQVVARRLGRVGRELIDGYLEGGMVAAEGHRDLVESTRQCSAQTIERRRHQAEPPLIVDVRTPAEFAAEHIPGAISLPLSGLWNRAGELPMGRELAIVCRRGHRSSTALSLLKAEGITTTCNLEGGMDAWSAAGFPVERSNGSR